MWSCGWCWLGSRSGLVSAQDLTRWLLLSEWVRCYAFEVWTLLGGSHPLRDVSAHRRAPRVELCPLHRSPWSRGQHCHRLPKTCCFLFNFTLLKNPRAHGFQLLLCPEPRHSRSLLFILRLRRVLSHGPHWNKQGVVDLFELLCNHAIDWWTTIEDDYAFWFDLNLYFYFELYNLGEMSVCLIS